MSQATNEMWNLTWERYVSRRGAGMKTYKVKGSDNSKKKIIITNDGKVTKARYFDNEKLICTGIATCHDDDMFDVFKGAELALERCRTKKMINDQYGYKMKPSNIEKFMDGDLAVECRLNQVAEFLNWCERRGIDVSADKSIEAYERYMCFETIIFCLDSDDERLISFGYSKEHPHQRYIMTYYQSIMSFNDFFKLPEGVSIR